MRNDLVHGKQIPSTEASKNFLCSYMNSLHNIKYQSTDQIIKGKAPMAGYTPSSAAVSRKPDPHWNPPPTGMVALSVDGSFSAADGTAGAGMILRNSDGEVVFAACQVLFFCTTALEAELRAILEGMEAALRFTDLPVIVQSDSLGALSSLTDDSLA